MPERDLSVLASQRKFSAESFRQVVFISSVGGLLRHNVIKLLYETSR